MNSETRAALYSWIGPLIVLALFVVSGVAITFAVSSVACGAVR